MTKRAPFSAGGGGPPGRRPGRETCPACPFAGLTGAEAACPSCGTDLSVLRAVQGLPDRFLADAVALAADGDLEEAFGALAAAARFDRTREAASALSRAWRRACPNPSCALFGRAGGRNVRLLAVATESAAEGGHRWRCRACGRAFPGAGVPARSGSANGSHG